MSGDRREWHGPYIAPDAPYRHVLAAIREKEAECWDAMKLVLPPGWEIRQQGADGAAYANASQGLAVITSVARELDGNRWLHVSVSRRSRLPSWEDLQHVKDVFVGRHRKAVQVLPPAAQHVNIMPTCLHLWHCLSADPLPDFTRGSGSI